MATAKGKNGWFLAKKKRRKERTDDEKTQNAKINLKLKRSVRPERRIPMGKTKGVPTSGKRKKEKERKKKRLKKGREAKWDQGALKQGSRGLAEKARQRGVQQ